jgi:electron-transferring-flavoprotein dehydrogenase
VKEVWEVKKPLDRVIHTAGWPLRFGPKYREFGGSFIYPMGEDKISLGIVVGLDYRDARFSAHDALQELKTHPLVADLIEDGKRVGWGAKTIPSGGYWAMPQRLWAPGLVLTGDGAGMCNVSELKGIHYAMHAGIYAAEAIVERLKSGKTDDLSNYEDRVRDSVIVEDLYRTRNMRQPASKLGFFAGSAVGSMMILSGGRFPGGRWATHDDATVDVFVGKERDYPKPDGKQTFDKLSSVFLSGNATRDDAPNHIRLQEKVPLELALMWQNMCPAQVYEVPEEELENGFDPKREVDLNVTPSNCVQCGAITAKGGRLTPPEGGDGPNYQQT